MAWHSKKKIEQFLIDKINLLKKQSCIKGREKRIVSRTNTYRRLYLHLYKRLLFSYNHHIEDITPGLSNASYNSCKRLIKELNEELEYTDVAYTSKQRNYIIWVRKMLQKYAYEHNFKNSLIILILIEKFNGHIEMVRSIYCYL